MTRAARTSDRASGFTLIEIVLVLAIASIIMGGAIGLMRFSSDERTLRTASGKIELLAKRARTAAILHQTAYALEFRGHSVRMLLWAKANDDLLHISKIITAEGAGAADGENQVDLGELTIGLRRWNAAKWIPLGEEDMQVWRFDPDGLCEPIAVRLATSKSSSEDTYHPLTASIQDSQLDAR